MTAALKNLTSLPPAVADVAVERAVERRTRILICELAPGAFEYMTVGERNLRDARGQRVGDVVATARPGGVVS